MPTPITNTSVTFNYNIADEMYSQTNTQNKTATATYTGPDRIWAFVWNSNGKLADHPTLTSLDDGADVPTPMDMTKVEIVAEDTPLIMSIIFPQRAVTQNQNTISETLPDGSIKQYNEFHEVGQTYSSDDLVFDIENKVWSDPPFMKSPISWTDLITVRNEMLKASDGRIAPDMPESLKNLWINYRQSLRDFPATFGYGTNNEIAAWKISLPPYPVE